QVMADLQLGVGPRLDAANQLHDQLVAENERRVALLARRALHRRRGGGIDGPSQHVEGARAAGDEATFVAGEAARTGNRVEQKWRAPPVQPLVAPPPPCPPP